MGTSDSYTNHDSSNCTETGIDSGREEGGLGGQRAQSLFLSPALPDTSPHLPRKRQHLLRVQWPDWARHNVPGHSERSPETSTKASPLACVPTGSVAARYTRSFRNCQFRPTPRGCQTFQIFFPGEGPVMGLSPGAQLSGQPTT